jgi:hypothetical protein
MQAFDLQASGEVAAGSSLPDLCQATGGHDDPLARLGSTEAVS